MPDLETIRSNLLSGKYSIRELKDHRDNKEAFIPFFTTCRVYSLHDQSGQIAGYYKEEKYGLFGGAVMNRLAYEMAAILNLESRLIPTDKIEAFTCEGISYQGGAIQPFQEGITLKEYRSNPESRMSMILKDEYTDAFLTSVILGLFDAHANNIIVSSDGKIHFIDLTRSFPHANTFLDRGGYLSYPFRCDLILKKESSLILPLKKRKELLSTLQSMQEKLPEIKRYLVSEKVKKDVESLPLKWFHPKKIYLATKQRIGDLINAIQAQEVSQVRDFAFKAYPYLQFIYIVNYCMLLDWRAHARNEHLLNRCLRDIELPLFYELIPAPIEAMFDECVKLGLDPITLKDCSQHNTLVEAMSCIVHYVQEKLIHPETPIEQNFLSKQAELLKSELRKISAEDFKDWGENYPEEDFFNS